MPVPFLDQTPFALEGLAHTTLAFSDLDGTLLAPGGCVLADAAGAPWLGAVEAIAAVNRARLDVVICTGRNRIQAGEISRLLGWNSFIAELGCIIMYDRRKPAEYLLGDWPDDALLPGETPHQAIERIGALRVLAATFPGKIEEHSPWHTDREVTHVLRGNVNREAAQAALDTMSLPVDIIDNGIINPPLHTLTDVAEVHAYHLVPRGTSKELAVHRMLECRGVTRADTVAIGDSATDVRMMRACGLGVIVANALADERVLAVANGLEHIVATHAERSEGWAEFANAWLTARMR